MAGVYQIYNKETNKRYIGSSINIERRLKEHKRNLKANRHSNQHLQNAWNKYQEYLIFEALEYCEPDQCLKLEQEYIDYYNSANREFGYNIDPQAASAGKHLSEETNRRLGIDKGAIKYALDNTGGFMKKLDCYFIKVVGEK